MLVRRRAIENVEMVSDTGGDDRPFGALSHWPVLGPKFSAIFPSHPWFASFDGFARAVIAGRGVGCDICAALLTDIPEPGQEVEILDGYTPGLRGVVSSQRLPHQPPRGFLIELGGDEQRIVSPGDIFQRLPGVPRPNWMPPLASAVDLVRFHGDVTAFFALFRNKHEERRLMAAYSFVVAIWRPRLPLTPEEVSRVLERHGLTEEDTKLVEMLYRHGREILVMASGRKPIQKKRVDYRRSRPVTRRNQ